MACLQWAQAYRQPRGTCGDLLTSGDVLVILPGQNSKCTHAQVTIIWAV